MNKLEAMHTFVRVAQVGSFAAAAQQLQVDRSVITRQVAALERQLRTQLITRSTRSLSLTAAGQAYLAQCQHILTLVEEAESGLSQEKEQVAGRIRLGLPLTHGVQVLMPLLLDFMAQHPDLALGLDLSDQRSNLVEEGIDLAIRITSRLQPTDIVRRLGQCRLMTVASPAHWAQHGVPQRPQDLAEHPALLYAGGSQSVQWPYRVRGRAVAVPMRGRLEANNGVALMQAAAAGLGVALQPDFIAQPWVDQGAVVEVLAPFAAEPLGIYAVLPHNRYVPHRVRALMEFLAERLAQGGAQAAPLTAKAQRPARASGRQRSR